MYLFRKTFFHDYSLNYEGLVLRSPMICLLNSQPEKNRMGSFLRSNLGLSVQGIHGNPAMRVELEILNVWLFKQIVVPLTLFHGTTLGHFVGPFDTKHYIFEQHLCVMSQILTHTPAMLKILLSSSCPFGHHLSSVQDLLVDGCSGLYYPNSWMVYKGTSYKNGWFMMIWGYPHFRKTSNILEMIKIRESLWINQYVMDMMNWRRNRWFFRWPQGISGSSPSSPADRDSDTASESSSHSRQGRASAVRCGDCLFLWAPKSMVSPWFIIIIPYGYGSIPINTIFSGMNIHLPVIWGSLGYQGFWLIPISYLSIAKKGGLIPILINHMVRCTSKSDIVKACGICWS